MLLMPSGEPLCGPSFVQCRFTYNGAWNEALYRFADELLEGLTQLWKRGYSQLVFYLEACDSASLFESYDTQLRSLSILAVTASRAAENAYATYVLIPQPLPSRYAGPVLVFVPNHVSDRYCCDYFRPPSCTVAGEDIGACLGDLWSAFIWEDIDLGSANETLRTQIAASKEKILPKGDQVPACLAIVCGLTPRISHWDPRLSLFQGSHVCQFGDAAIADEPLSAFFGAPIGQPINRSPATLAWHSIPSRSARLQPLDTGSTGAAGRHAPLAIMKEKVRRGRLEAAMRGVMQRTGSMVDPEVGTLADGSEGRYSCYRELVGTWSLACGDLDEFSAGLMRSLWSLCAEWHVSPSVDKAKQAVRDECASASSSDKAAGARVG
jgi:hypothetical protein